MDANEFLRLKVLFNRYVEVPAPQRDARMAADPELDEESRAKLCALFEADSVMVHMTARSALGVAAAASDPVAHWIGRRIGAFVIARELGSGGMGVVYHATRADGEVNQEAAIKVLRSGVMDVAARERFQRERELLARFSHPNIARLLDAGVSADGQPYFVMDYVHGTTITRYCDGQRLSVDARLRLFLKVCDAVLYAHRQLVLHRDIKPNNVLMDERGEPKLIDFGIAKPLLLGAENVATVTQQRFFSPLNAAPEQLQGEAVGVACDVYQLGTLLYELLCGRPIFDLQGKSPGAIERAIREQVPAPPSVRIAPDDMSVAQARHCGDVRALRRQLHGDLDAIVLCALRKEPQRRYATVEQFADDVTRFLGNRPVHGRRGSVSYRLSLFFKRNWQPVILAATVFVSFGIFVWIVVGERNKAVVERGRSEAVTQFLIEMFRSAEPTATTSPDMPVSAALQRGETMLDRSAALDPTTRVKLMVTLAQVKSSLSDLPGASAMMDKAIALARDPRVDRRVLADALQQKAGSDYGAEKAYEPSASEAVAIYDSLGISVGDSYYARLLLLRSKYATDKSGSCAGVEQLLQAVRREAGKDKALAGTLRDAVRCRDRSPETLARTVADLREAIAGITSRTGPDDVNVQQLQVRLARALRELHRYDEADAVLQPVLQRQLKIFGEHSWDVAYTLSTLGSIAVERERYDEAEAYLLRAHEQYTRMHKSGPNLDYSRSAFALARLYELSGKDPSKSGEYYEAALQTASPLDGPIELEIGRICYFYGTLLQRQGDKVRAEELLRKAIANLPSTQTMAAQARVNLAELLLDGGDSEHARQLIGEAEPVLAAQPDPASSAQLAQMKARVSAIRH